MGPKIQRLEERFKLIETVRFNGGRSGISIEAQKISFDEVKKLTEEICISYSTSASSEEADDLD